MKIAQRFIAGVRIVTPYRVPEGRMNIGVSSTICPSHEWLGYFHMLLTEQLPSQVLCFDYDCVTSGVIHPLQDAKPDSR